MVPEENQKAIAAANLSTFLKIGVTPDSGVARAELPTQDAGVVIRSLICTSLQILGFDLRNTSHDREVLIVGNTDSVIEPPNLNGVLAFSEAGTKRLVDSNVSALALDALKGKQSKISPDRF